MLMLLLPLPLPLRATGCVRDPKKSVCSKGSMMMSRMLSVASQWSASKELQLLLLFEMWERDRELLG